MSISAITTQSIAIGNFSVSGSTPLLVFGL